MNIETEYFYSIDYDIDRILSSALNLKNNIYIENGFYPVTKAFKGNKKTIIFPPISKKGYKLFPELTDDSFRRLAIPSSLKSSKLTVYLQNILSKSTLKLDLNSVRSIENQWKSIEQSFYDFIEYFLNLSEHKIKINIIVSQYGSYVSFGQEKKSKKQDILYVSVRDDMGPYEIAEGILSALFLDTAKQENLSWREREATIDFILKHTRLNKILSKFSDNTGTLDIVKSLNKDTEILKNSKEFLDEIGFIYEGTLLVQGNNVLINGTIPKISFSPSETKVLKLLLEKNKKISSYFDIANVLWENTDSFSIWAISRIIHTLRKKLEANGISSDKLITYKNKGFLLNI